MGTSIDAAGGSLADPERYFSEGFLAHLVGDEAIGERLPCATGGGPDPADPPSRSRSASSGVDAPVEYDWSGIRQT
jgi:hypothetical protein